MTMKQNWPNPIIIIFSTSLVIVWILLNSNLTSVFAQQPTETPTTELPSTGIFVTVITEEPQINVRMGPSSSVYPIVGTMARGSTALALGRSKGGDWIQIVFEGAPNNSGWVYSPLVAVSAGTLRIVEPPPTPIPPATSTIDPTLAAQFVIIPTNTRPPTYTPPPSLTSVVFTQLPSGRSNNFVPIAVIIIALAFLGVIGFLLSLILRR